MCLCTTPRAITKPTPRAKGLGRLLLYIMIILGILAIIGFFGSMSFMISLFGLATVITGWCGVRNDMAYNIEQIMCVIFLSGYLWVYSLVEMIIYLANGYDGIVTLIALFGGIIFYACSCYLAKLLYDDLRQNYDQPTADEYQPGFFNGGGMGNRFGGGGRGMGMGGGLFNRGGGGGGGGYQQPMADQQYQQGAYNQGSVQQGNNNNNDDASQKFRAFTGTGHTLG